MVWPSPRPKPASRTSSIASAACGRSCTGQPVVDLNTAKTSDTTRFALFWAMMDRGVYLPCSQSQAAFVSTAHTEQHIDQTIQAARESFRETNAK